MVLRTWDNTPKAEDRERCYDVIGLLARAGAKLDPDHWRDPGKNGSDMLEKIESDLRVRAALGGNNGTKLRVKEAYD